MTIFTRGGAVMTAETTLDINLTPEPFRILVTGSRKWTDWHIIEAAIREAASGHDLAIVVHGACPAGADAIADRIARGLGFPVKSHPADWQRYGRAAGPIRNAEMTGLGAGICLAFIRDGSPGSTHCARLAEEAGILVRRFGTPHGSAPAALDGGSHGGGTADDAIDMGYLSPPADLQADIESASTKPREGDAR